MVVAALMMTTVLAVELTAYCSGVGGARRCVGTMLISLLVAVLIVLTIELDRSDRGTIEVPTKPLT